MGRVHLFLELVRIFRLDQNNLIGCDVLQFHQCVQDKNSYEDENSPNVVDPSLDLSFSRDTHFFKQEDKSIATREKNTSDCR